MVRVVERAIEITTVDFGVSCGVRTEAEQYRAVKNGTSTTMKSKHMVQADFFGHAVDLFVIVDGEVTWEHEHFRKAVQAMFTAAIELGVQLKAGALWRDFQDSPHFELNDQYY